MAGELDRLIKGWVKWKSARMIASCKGRVRGLGGEDLFSGAGVVFDREGMSDTTPSSETPSQAAPASAPAPASTGPQMSMKELQDGKVFAILCYALSIICIPFWLLPIIMRNNAFSLYHSKQVLMLWLVGVATGAVAWVPCAGWILAIVVFIGLLVLNVIGLLNAVGERCRPLPVVGKLADQWFAGITKVQS